MSIRIAVLIIFSGLISGCTSSAVFVNHGDVVAHNTNAQTVNQAVVVAMEAPELDGPKGQQVMETYRTDTGKATGEQIIVNIGSGSNGG